MALHSIELRRALQTGGDFLLSRYGHRADVGIVILLNRIVTDINLVRGEHAQIGVWNPFSDRKLIHNVFRFTTFYYKFIAATCPAGMLEMLIGHRAFTRLCLKYPTRQSLTDKIPLYLN